jgi:hypothetical protein
MHYPPPYQDLATLARHICCGERTIEAWVQQGLFPKPRLQGGKRLWRWADVDTYLSARDDTNPIDTVAQRIKDATQKAVQARDTLR